MSAKSCTACNDIREYAPEFATNGVTYDVCESLSANTGLNPNLSSKHEDCDDLHDINDCLIGNMDDEIEAFDVCEWKDYMHQYVPNNYETIKAMICSMCGQWDKIESICELTQALLSPPYAKYGTVPARTDTSHRCGTIPNKGGSPIMKAVANPNTPGTEEYALYNQWQNVGVQYATTRVQSCLTGRCRRYEWFYPDFFGYNLSSAVEVGDVLWYVDKSTVQSVVGFSDEFWHVYTVSSWTWSEISITTGNARGKSIWVNMTVSPGGMGNNYLGLVFEGTSYPNQLPGYDAYLRMGSNPGRMLDSAC